MKEPIAVTVAEASRLTGVSVRAIRRAVDRGELELRYPTARPVVLIADLVTWVSAAPTTRQGAHAVAAARTEQETAA